MSLIEERPAAPSLAPIGRDQEERIASQRFFHHAAGPPMLEIGELDLVQCRAFDPRSRLGPGCSSIPAHQQNAVESGGHGMQVSRRENGGSHSFRGGEFQKYVAGLLFGTRQAEFVDIGGRTGILEAYRILGVEQEREYQREQKR